MQKGIFLSFTMKVNTYALIKRCKLTPNNIIKPNKHIIFSSQIKLPHNILFTNHSNVLYGLNAKHQKSCANCFRR